MEEPRTVLEWLFDGLAAIGFLILVIAWLSREPLVVGFDTAAYAWSAVGLALLIGGIAASKWCKRKRLSTIINGTGGGHAN